MKIHIQYPDDRTFLLNYQGDEELGDTYVHAGQPCVRAGELNGFPLFVPAEPSEANAAADQDDDESPEPSVYTPMSVDELKAELASRDLAVSGKKAELIARLEEDDA